MDRTMDIAGLREQIIGQLPLYLEQLGWLTATAQSERTQPLPRQSSLPGAISRQRQLQRQCHCCANRRRIRGLSSHAGSPPNFWVGRDTAQGTGCPRPPLRAPEPLVGDGRGADEEPREVLQPGEYGGVEAGRLNVVAVPSQRSEVLGVSNLLEGALHKERGVTGGIACSGAVLVRTKAGNSRSRHIHFSPHYSHALANNLVISSTLLRTCHVLF